MPFLVKLLHMFFPVLFFCDENNVLRDNLYINQLQNNWHENLFFSNVGIDTETFGGNAL